MSNSRKVWIPAGVPQGAEMALSVDAPRELMTPALYRSLLIQKLDGLILADPKAARRALEMSQEQAPELWAIAEQFPTSQWASAIVMSDQVTALLSPITGKGRLAKPESPQSLLEILEQLT